MTKKRVNLTLSDTARENAGLIARELGISLSGAIEIALGNEVTRLELRRPLDIRTVEVEFDRERLTAEAQRMLDIAKAQGVLVRDTCITVWDNDELGLDDTLRIKVRSLISYEERALRFGISGLDIGQIERGADGKPTYRMGEGGDSAMIPSMQYIENVKRAYGEHLDQIKFWEVPSEIVRAIRSGKLVGNAAIEVIATRLFEWCRYGEWEPV